MFFFIVFSPFFGIILIKILLFLSLFSLKGRKYFHLRTSPQIVGLTGCSPAEPVSVYKDETKKMLFKFKSKFGKKLEPKKCPLETIV
ncbi:hypothetical protein CCAN12_710001 [Capnocytophaga canimorsus]|uniref:Uncharacterized protein n=1 Tax=Capnocytophaga canimorsus TaxID=28188 RepID=A0A0B7HD54_9FLAO|nr:hypothetical protein CCAN12_710001 [Capnocytophaga canimorsus]